MTLDPLAQIAILEKALSHIHGIEDVNNVQAISHLNYAAGLLEGMKEMLEYSAGKCKPEDQF